MKQDAFDAFYAPVPVPIQGLTAESRDASRTGADAAAFTLAHRQERYLKLLKRGPLNDFDAASLLKCGVNSINSVRNSPAVKPKVCPDGHDVHRFVDALGVPRQTLRTRWRLRI